ncbi:MAG: hypothetical protein JSU96_09940 [Acidobacteriota bacterium]|nr:MAG: hypothetical protein JSU96_09940 [Acidobacteriota bacterium]
MRKKLYWLLGVLLVLAAGSLILMKLYSTELVHVVVVNAVVQKAPSGYPVEKVRRVFDESLIKAQNEGREEDYLEKLKVISQRLEKVQHMEAFEVDELLNELAER